MILSVQMDDELAADLAAEAKRTGVSRNAVTSALEAGRIRAELHRQGKPIGPFDTLLAGVARAHGLTMITENVGEFRRVRDLKWEAWGLN